MLFCIRGCILDATKMIIGKTFHFNRASQIFLLRYMLEIWDQHHGGDSSPRLFRAALQVLYVPAGGVVSGLDRSGVCYRSPIGVRKRCWYLEARQALPD